MFEDSVFESRGALASPGRRWTAAASLALQCIAAAVVVVLPLLHPEVLSYGSSAPKAMLLAPMRPPKPPEVVHVVHITTTANAMNAPAAAVEVAQGHLSRPSGAPGTAPLLLGDAPAMTSPGLPGALLDAGVARGVRVSAWPGEAASGGGAPMRVSAGVSRGRLLHEIQPVYPRIAVAAHVQGAVVVEAVISRTGAIESARVVSGPGMLAAAALDAVRAARYQPFLLNGQPTEVETTITVNFRLGG